MELCNGVRACAGIGYARVVRVILADQSYTK
jgi:hypothetical protein